MQSLGKQLPWAGEGDVLHVCLLEEVSLGDAAYCTVSGGLSSHLYFKLYEETAPRVTVPNLNRQRDGPEPR